MLERLFNIRLNNIRKLRRKLRIIMYSVLIGVNFAVHSPIVYAQSESTTRDSNVQNVIRVTDFGADPSGKSDSTLAIQRAIEAARLIQGPKKIIFDRGEYHFRPEFAVEKEMYISNTVGDNQSYKMKKIGIYLENINDVTIDGGNSKFIFHGKMQTLTTVNAQNIKFKNFSIDFETPTVVDLFVERVTGNQVTYYVPESYQYEVSGTTVTWKSDINPVTNQPYWTTQNGMNYTQVHDLKSGLTWRDSNPIFNDVATIEDVGNRRLVFTYTNRSEALREGLSYQMRPTVRDHAGTFFVGSKDIQLENLNIHFIHGFGMVVQTSENFHMNNVHFKAPDGSLRTTAGYADFIQVSGSKGNILIENSSFANPHDDPINIHGTFLQVVEKLSDRQVKVRYMHHETAGFPSFFVGDEIEFSTRGNMISVPNSKAIVTAVDGPDGFSSAKNLREIILTLDRPIPSEVSANQHVVENISYTPSVTIRNNHFRSTPTRGILVTTRKPVLIENNTFEGMGMASIYISNDAQNWYESGPSKDVMIRGNHFTGNGINGGHNAPIIFIEPTNPTVSLDATVHENILIEDNTFYVNNSNIVNAKSVQHLVFQNNRIARFVGEPFITLSAPKSEIVMNETLNLNTNFNKNRFNLFHLNGVTNTVLRNNSYDVTLNKSGYTINNNRDNAIQQEGDSIRFNDDTSLVNLSELVHYETSNDNVVIDKQGRIQGKKVGTTTIRAYIVSNMQTFYSEPVTINVTQGDISPTPILSSDLSIVREIRDDLIFTNGEPDLIRIKANEGSLWATGTSSNIILKDVSNAENVTAIVKVSGKTRDSYDEAGLILYKDDNNYVIANRKHANGNPGIHVVNEVNGQPNEDGKLSNVEENDLYYKLVKTGDRIEGLYSIDKQNWTPIRTVTNANLGSAFKIGLIVAGGSNTQTPFTFSELTINDQVINLVDNESNNQDVHSEENRPKPTNATYLDEVLINGESFDVSSKQPYYLINHVVSENVVDLTIRSKDSEAIISVYHNDKLVKEDKGSIDLSQFELRSIGKNYFDVIVSDTNYTTRQYRFVDYRGVETNQNLNQLLINGEPLVDFSSDKYEYHLTTNLDKINVLADLIDYRSNVSLTLNNQRVEATSSEFNLKSGTNTLIVGVESATGERRTHYVLKIRVADDTNSLLDDMHFDNAIMTQPFSKTLTDYTAQTTNHRPSVHLLADNPNASITLLVNDREFTGIGQLSTEIPVFVGENEMKVVVKAPNGTSREYKTLINAVDSVYMSDLSYTTNSRTGYGQIMKDKNVDGGAISLETATGREIYDKGIGLHASGQVEYDIAGKGFTRFDAMIGLDASQTRHGEMKVKVYIDDNKVEEFIVSAVNNIAHMVSIDDLTGVKKLRIEVDQMENDWNDHLSIGNARFVTSLPQKEFNSVTVISENGASFTANKETLSYVNGGKVQLSAQIDPEYEFLGWYNGERLVSNQLMYTFDIDSNQTLTIKTKVREPKERKVTVVVPFATKHIMDNSLFIGTEIIEQEGKNGSYVNVYHDIYVDGIIVKEGTNVIRVENESSAIIRIIRIGTKPLDINNMQDSSNQSIVKNVNHLLATKKAPDTSDSEGNSLYLGILSLLGLVILLMNRKK